MKKLLTAILSLSLLGAAALPALADNGKAPMTASSEAEITAPEEDSASASTFTIEVDGKQVNARPCVMVPVRAVAEKLGFTVSWDSGVVTVTGPERYARIIIGKDEYFAAPTQKGMMGASLFSLGCAPYVTNGATYAPVELFDALLGCRPGTVKGYIERKRWIVRAGDMDRRSLCLLPVHFLWRFVGRLVHDFKAK